VFVTFTRLFDFTRYVVVTFTFGYVTFSTFVRYVTFSLPVAFMFVVPVCSGYVYLPRCVCHVYVYFVSIFVVVSFGWYVVLRCCCSLLRYVPVVLRLLLRYVVRSCFVVVQVVLRYVSGFALFYVRLRYLLPFAFVVVVRYRCVTVTFTTFCWLLYALPLRCWTFRVYVALLIGTLPVVTFYVTLLFCCLLFVCLVCYVCSRSRLRLDLLRCSVVPFTFTRLIRVYVTVLVWLRFGLLVYVGSLPAVYVYVGSLRYVVGSRLPVYAFTARFVCCCLLPLQTLFGFGRFPVLLLLYVCYRYRFTFPFGCVTLRTLFYPHRLDPRWFCWLRVRFVPHPVPFV